MYCRYVSTTTATQAQVLSDIVSLMTGSVTDKNNLSASCDKSNTELVTTTAGGWTVHDAAAGTNTQVLKAAVADNPSQFKYLWISTAATTYIEFRLYEGWNATTHTGTNPVSTTSSTTGQRITNYTTAFTVFLASSNRFHYAYTMGGSSNNGNTSSYPAITFEHTRWSPWDTVSNGYLPTAGTGNSSPAWCRVRGTNGSDLTAQSGSCYTPVGTANLTKVVNAAGVSIIPAMSLIVSAGNVGAYGGNVTDLSGVMVTCNGLGSAGDELSLNSTTYIYGPNIGGGYVLIPKA